MDPIPVVVAVKQQLHRDVLRELLESREELCVVAAVPNEIAAAVVLHRFLSDRPITPERPVLVVIVADQDDEVPKACTRLLTEFPHLIVISFCWPTGTIYMFRSTIDAIRLPSSIDGLISQLRTLADRGNMTARPDQS